MSGFEPMRFIESIHFLDGRYANLDLHQQRIDRTLNQFASETEGLSLNRILPTIDPQGRHKVRVVYQIHPKSVSYDVTYATYTPRVIKTLELVHATGLDYAYKYEDRELINALFNRSKADDIVIVKDDKITDSSYANLVFWDGSAWVTSTTPLLNGVKRQRLLQEGIIREAPLRVTDLGAFEKVSLINAMLGLGEVEVEASNIDCS